MRMLENARHVVKTIQKTVKVPLTCVNCGDAEECNCDILTNQTILVKKNVKEKKGEDLMEETTTTGGTIKRTNNRNLNENRIAKKMAVELVDEIEKMSKKDTEKILHYLSAHVSCINSKLESEKEIDIDSFVVATDMIVEVLNKTKAFNLGSDKLKSFFKKLETEIQDCL